MQIKSGKQGDVAIVEPAGSIDVRASLDFERHILELLEGGARRFALDFAKVELITSGGIRVLVMLAQRLQGIGGGLVLYALSDQVRTVFDVAGLMRHFRIASSRQEAIAQLTTDPQAPAASTSRLSRLTSRLLGGVGQAAASKGAAPEPADGATKSELSSQVAQLLSGSTVRRGGHGHSS